MATEEENKQDGVVAIELPAPAGWVKKCSPKKSGTPQRNDIVFISPTGEKIKNKRQLDQYLKSHSGGPAASEFDWGTGDSPRRSARLSGKSKAVEGLAISHSPKKRRKTSGPKGAEEKSNADGEGGATDEKDAYPEETKENADVDTKEATNEKDVDPDETKENADVETKEATNQKDADPDETKENADVETKEATNQKDADPEETNDNADVDAKEAGDGEIMTEGAIPEKPNFEEVEMKLASEEPSAVETQTDAHTENLNAHFEKSNDAELEEFKDEPSGKEIQDGEVDFPALVVEDKDDLKEKQEAEKPVENDAELQQPTTGSYC